MIADLKPYPAYKDSGVPWLGEMPEHWDLSRLGHLLKERGELNTNESVADVLSLLSARGVIPYSEKGNIGNKRSEDISRYKIVRPNDIVVNSMNVIIGSVGLSKYTGCLSPVYYVLTRRNHEDNPNYLNAYFQTSPFQKSLVRIGFGILAHRMRIPMELLKREVFPHPPPSEQAAIVRFLKHADRKIRHYIRSKQKLIKLLEEQKQAIINQSVTKGLDPNARMKSSGVEWLGEVPEHWEVVRLKEVITQIEQGWSPQCDAQPAENNEWGVLKVGCVNKEMFDPSKNKRLPNNLEPIPVLEVSEGDILVSRANTRELLGLASLVEGTRGKLLLCDKLYRFHNKVSKSDSKFLVSIMRAKIGRRQIESNTNGASDSMQNISQSVIKNLWIVLPPIDEQVRISTFIQTEAASIESAKLRTKREIDLLFEYRTRLVADVVTGKLDVREAAANLPDLGDELDVDGLSNESDITADPDELGEVENVEEVMLEG